jgi:Zn-finger nucleic acid-binding protein
MRCPLCTDEELEAHHRAGIEIDICPRCRGVWLDRGELDRLASDDEPTPAATPSPPAPLAAASRDRWVDDRPSGKDRSRSERSRRDDDDHDDDHDDDDHDDDHDRRGDSRRKKSKKRRKSLASRLEDVLDEVFDL